MLQHVVVAKFKEGVPAQDQADVAAGLRALPAQIAEIRRYEVGLDTLHSARSYDLGIVSAFDDAAALERYQTHPAHVAASQRLRAISQSIIVVDYELTPPQPAPAAHPHEKIVQGVAERLMEDERLRADLTDDEAKLVMRWAVDWVAGQVAQAGDESAARQTAQAELSRLRPAMREINDMLSESVDSASAVALSVGDGQPDRQSIIRRQIEQLTEAWSKR